MTLTAQQPLVTSRASRCRRSPRCSAAASRSTPTATTRRSACRRARPRPSRFARSRSSRTRAASPTSSTRSAGSYAVESLTTRLEKLAGEYLARIDELGGMVRRHRAGLPAARDPAHGVRVPARDRAQGAPRRRAERVHAGGGAGAGDEGRPAHRGEQVERLRAMRARRDAAAHAAALERIERAARGRDNLLPHILEAVKADATVGEIANVLRAGLGRARRDAGGLEAALHFPPCAGCCLLRGGAAHGRGVQLARCSRAAHHPLRRRLGRAGSTGRSTRASSTPAATPTPYLGGPCVDDAQCNDGIACTYDSCDKAVGRCLNVPDNTQCQDGVYCDGQEICDPSLGCEPGTVVSCDNGERLRDRDTASRPRSRASYTPRDVDQDGDPDAHCDPRHDCNDLDPDVSSLHAEVCANGIDDNCNGLIDEHPCVTPAGRHAAWRR